ncbi:MAG TPA: hypothetical protein DIU39_03120 [Flavobacteriales bacterium]|nr:hypothetical protein [Flavobacteriales bacterium]|tara:strand:+ start:1538 stop:2128 length:591 start_codon:yes stop_codon:yes gene_type:complete
MLIIEKEINPGTKLLVWKITEPLSFFLSAMPENFFTETKNINNQRIILQKAIKYYLTQKIFPDTDIIKDENGKPYLTNNKHLSVSHSENMACVVFSDKNCGVDIEKISDKVLRVKRKFINNDESKRFPNDKNSLTLMWCCKESLYKLYNIRGIDYKNNFVIQSIDYAQNTVQAKVNSNTHTLYFELIEDYFLTFTF